MIVKTNLNFLQQKKMYMNNIPSLNVTFHFTYFSALPKDGNNMNWSSASLAVNAVI
jgi:hypothetical protein